jgi:hypothetical protein
MHLQIYGIKKNGLIQLSNCRKRARVDLQACQDANIAKVWCGGITSLSCVFEV